jgi:rhombotail lipoprotein
MRTILAAVCICLTLCLGSACAGPVRTVQKQSNLATYLFGGNAPQGPVQKVPLKLPARVGVAFVPGDLATQNIPDTTKRDVIEAVRSQLAKHTKYVAGAQSIPALYLTPKGGVCNLEQVARQFDVDVIVLLGASQFQKHERNSLAAFLDLTVIGAFIIPGNTVDTATVLEAAVYHVPSRAMVFRSDGADQKRSRSTRFGANQSAQNDAVSSIEEASKKLVVSIADALVNFEKFDVSTASEIKAIPVADGDSTRNGRENYWGQVSSFRSSGGGAMDSIWILMTGAALLCSAIVRKQR